MTRVGRIAARAAVGLLIIAALAWFAYANAGQSVTLRFGLFTIRSIAVPIALYAAVIVGMLVMLAAGLRGELRTQAALKRYDQIAARTLSDFEAEERDSTPDSEQAVSGSDPIAAPRESS